MRPRNTTPARLSRRAMRFSLAASVAIVLGACAGTTEADDLDVVPANQNQTDDNHVDETYADNSDVDEIQGDDNYVEPPTVPVSPTRSVPPPSPPPPPADPPNDGCAGGREDHDFDGICDDEDIDTGGDRDGDGITNYDDLEPDNPVWND